MKNIFNYAYKLAVITIISVITSKVLGRTIVEVLFSALIIVLINYYVSKFLLKQRQERAVEESLVVAKKSLVSNETLIIIMTDENKNVIWANDVAYGEFPSLLKKQVFDLFDGQKLDETIFYNNKYYECNHEDGLYMITDITKTQREIRNYKNKQTVIGIVQIDNYVYLESQLSSEAFLKLESFTNMKLIKWFNDDGIYYQAIDDDKFQINIPYSALEKQIESRFSEIGKIVDEAKSLEYEVTISVGIAYNYDSIYEIGQKAREALELARSRGGAQVVVFNDDKRRYFGGRISSAKNFTKIRARFVYNTIYNNVREKEVLYIMSHRNPDYDAVASMLMIRDLFKENIEVKILVDAKIDHELKEKILEVAAGDIYFDTVIDKTKKNLLIVVDTQSTDIISHPNFYESIDDVIVIDHHQTPENYINVTLFSWIEPNASSSVEMIGNMMTSVSRTINDKKIVKLALLGVITDTNMFTYRTDQSTLEFCGFLTANGVKLSEAIEESYMNEHDFFEKQRIISSVQIQNSFAIINTDESLDDIIMSICVNEILKIKGVIASIIISKRRSDLYAVKVRSTTNFNSKLFLEEFGGGGHARQAAGILSPQKVEAMLEKIKKMKMTEE